MCRAAAPKGMMSCKTRGDFDWKPKTVCILCNKLKARNWRPEAEGQKLEARGWWPKAGGRRHETIGLRLLKGSGGV